jgi:Arc/MetJ family transcription regulator
MSRTNIDLDDDLLAQAMDVLGTSTKRDTIHTALRHVVADQAIDDLAEMVGEQFEGWTDAEIDAERTRAWHGEGAVSREGAA